MHIMNVWWTDKRAAPTRTGAPRHSCPYRKWPVPHQPTMRRQPRTGLTHIPNCPSRGARAFLPRHKNLGAGTTSIPHPTPPGPSTPTRPRPRQMQHCHCLQALCRRRTTALAYHDTWITTRDRPSGPETTATSPCRALGLCRATRVSPSTGMVHLGMLQLAAHLETWVHLATQRRPMDMPTRPRGANTIRLPTLGQRRPPSRAPLFPATTAALAKAAHTDTRSRTSRSRVTRQQPPAPTTQ